MASPTCGPLAGAAHRGGSNNTDADKLATGDSVRVEMQNVDAGVYEYFRTLNQILQGNPLLQHHPHHPRDPTFRGVPWAILAPIRGGSAVLIVPVL